MEDPNGKFGLGFLSAGYFFNIAHTLFIRADLAFWLGFVCTAIGGIYYLLKIYFDFIKKQK